MKIFRKLWESWLDLFPAPLVVVSIQSITRETGERYWKALTSEGWSLYAPMHDDGDPGLWVTTDHTFDVPSSYSQTLNAAIRTMLFRGEESADFSSMEAGGIRLD